MKVRPNRSNSIRPKQLDQRRTLHFLVGRYVYKNTHSEFFDLEDRKWDSLAKPILLNSAKRPYLAHFEEFFFGKVGIEIRQSGHRNSAKRARQLSTPAKTLFESENIMWGISDVCTLAITIAKTSSHYDRFAISVPARSLLLFDLA